MTKITMKWFKKAGIRAIKTMAQTAASVLGATAVFTQADLTLAFSSALSAGLLSLLWSMGGLPELEGDDESGINESEETE